MFSQTFQPLDFRAYSAKIPHGSQQTEEDQEIRISVQQRNRLYPSSSNPRIRKILATMLSINSPMIRPAAIQNSVYPSNLRMASPAALLTVVRHL